MTTTKVKSWWIMGVVALVLLGTVLAAAMYPGQAHAAGGPIFLSGDDADDGGHCQGTACGGLYPTALNSVVTNSTSGGTGIVAIGANSGNALNAFNSWNAVANGGPGAPVTHCNTTGAGNCIQTVNFANFEAIYIASSSGHTSGGLTQTQLDDLNTRQASIVNFVNTLGGGLMSLTEANMASQYGWLPLALSTANVNHFGPDIFPTPAMAPLSPVTSAQLNHGCCYHTVFTGPAGFSGLNVLAFHDHNGNKVYDGQGSTDEALILGGAKVTIQGNISLAPPNATNDTGTDHTVTATAEDGDPLVPAVGVLVTFTVSGVNNLGNAGGTCAPVTCLTDGSGQVSFTYTDTGGPGNDSIVAEFTDAAGGTQTSNTVGKTWEDPPDIDVSLDVHPTSCPNPVNSKGKGVVPAAILGTSSFDVTDIDLATILLEGVAPLRSSLEDVATPYTGGLSSPPDRNECTTDGPDGFTDLTLKFNKSELLGALGNPAKGSVIEVEIVALTLSGIPIFGSDVIWIR